MKSSPCFVSLGNSIISKGRVLYFRLSVPRRHREQVGLTEFRISLKTPYIDEARAHARLLSGKAQLVFQMLDRGAYSNMNKALVKELVMKNIREVLDYDEELRLGKEKPTSEEQLEINHSAATGFRDSYRQDLARCDYSSTEAFANIVIAEAKESGIDMSEFQKDTPSYRYLCQELMKASVRIFDEYAKRDRGQFDDYDLSAKDSPAAVPVPQPTVTIPQDSPKSALPLISEAAEIYVRENSFAERGKANWTTKSTILQHKTTIASIIASIGDMPISDITLAYIEQYRDYMFRIPANMQKKQRYKDKTYAELMAMDIPDEDRMSEQTIKNNFTRANTFIRWLCIKYQLPLRCDRVLAIKLQVNPDEERLPFTASDLEMLFNSWEYVNQAFGRASYFWVPLMGLFTGARLEEICQLYVKDFEQTEAGVWYISIEPDEDKRLKNKTAKRKVPIHDALIRLGLLKRVEHLKMRGFERLFPDLKKSVKLDRYSDAFSKWFTRFRRDTGIGIGDEEGKKTFHSFRHTLADYFKQKGFEGTPEWATLQNVIGHSSGEGETINRYSHKINPDVAYERIMCNLDYGLDLSHLMDSKYILMVEPCRQMHRKK